MEDLRFFGFPIDARFFLALAALLAAWSAYRSVTKGRVRSPYGALVLAERSNDPIMFWVYVAMQIAFGLVCAAYALQVIR